MTIDGTFLMTIVYALAANIDTTAWWYPFFYALVEVLVVIYTTVEYVFPIAISIIGVGLIVTLGVSLFKRVANKA